MIFVKLRKRHLPQREDHAVSSVKPIDNLAALHKEADRRQVTYIQLESDAAR